MTETEGLLELAQRVHAFIRETTPRVEFPVAPHDDGANSAHAWGSGWTKFAFTEPPHGFCLRPGCDAKRVLDMRRLVWVESR
jgi:hypothetical protein